MNGEEIHHYKDIFHLGTPEQPQPYTFMYEYQLASDAPAGHYEIKTIWHQMLGEYLGDIMCCALVTFDLEEQ